MNSSSNPYAVAPVEESTQPASVIHQPTSLMSIARTTFLAWEKLRVAYIVVLSILTLLLAGPHLARVTTLLMIIVGAVIANLCFFAGPISETYVRWLGYRGKGLRWVLFLSGTFLAAVLTMIVMASAFLPNQP